MNATTAQANPFNPRAVLALLLVGAAVFVGLLYLIGKGAGDDNFENRPGSHALGRGLDGYAALSRYFQQRGMAVKRLQDRSQLNRPGLLILTPPHFADPAEMARIVDSRRRIGPTMVITPKWLLHEAKPPDWPGFRDDVTLELKPMRASGKVAAWSGGGLNGALPNSENVMSGYADKLIPLVAGDQDGRVLAGYFLDEGYYPALSDLAVGKYPDEGEDEEVYPLILVFEPDLFNNYGMADGVNARLAERIVKAALDRSGDQSVTFDLTFNGFASSSNLLTLAFEPPFLAATLALILAALAVGWRAFNRFGPPSLTGPAIAYGKRALVGNAAGLIQRARRLHLVGGPYADAARERLVRALALSARSEPAEAEAAIDRALAARAPHVEPFSSAAARLRAARRPTEILHAAQDLNAIERMLKR
jgi:hypothetical protein